MKRIIIIHGLIAGIIVSTLMLLGINTISDFENGMVIGYASMLIAFSLVYVGIRNYRDNYNAGVLNFGMAFKTGIYIVLIASTIYVISWLIAYYFFMPDFLDKYSSYYLEKMKLAGASSTELDAKSKEMAEFALMYQNPFFNAMMTYLEILPVGLIVTIISALILKRKTVP
jgi:hypothetical protein